MTYYSSSTGVGASVQAQMRTAIPSNAAWSLVESTTFGFSYPSDVYKCDHTVSGLSADFYVAIIYNNSANLYIGIAEGYNATSHKPQRPAVKATSALQTLQTDGGLLPDDTEIDWYNGTYNPGGGSLSVVGSTVVATSFSPYAIVVAKDAIALIAGSDVCYAGAYETSLGTDDPLPILVAGSASAGNSYATRHPRRGGLGTGYACNLNGNRDAYENYGGMLSTWAYSDANMLLRSTPGAAASGDGYDSYQPDFGASKIAVLNSYGIASDTSGRYVNGWRRGWAKYFRMTSAGGFATLDSLTIDGTAYVYCKNGLWIEKDPA